MRLRVKHWILLSVIGCLLYLGLLISPSNANSAVDPSTIHLLNRISYGLRSGDIELVQSQGSKAYIASQLNPESLPQPPQLQRQIEELETLSLNPVELFMGYDTKASQERQETEPTEAEKKLARERSKEPLKQAIQAHILRAIYSPRQLQEVMVDFWFNHFNVFAGKRINRLWVGNYEESVIRPHALGKFRDLLGATARHPAMLLYLDNEQNTAPGSPGAKGRYKGLNENYARELMELHTLGVDGGYTQEDVITLAKIFTGWSIDRRGKQGDTGFQFARGRHDFNDKVFLGQAIAGSGVAEGEKALDILAQHPATARYISYKLSQYFVADEPPQSLVNKLAQRFQKTDGDIRLVLETLFQSEEFWDSKYYDAKFKTPYQYIISALRTTGIKQPKIKPILGFMRQLGMIPYGCETPNGYPNTQEGWLNPDGMMRRVSFAMALSNGHFSQDKPANTSQIANTLGNHLSANTKEAISSSPENLRKALIIGSPEMMRR